MWALELFHQLDIPKPAEIVVKADWEIVGIAFEGAIRLWRIRAQNIVTPDGKRGVVQQVRSPPQTS